MNTSTLQAAVDLLRPARVVVALTGAGISRPSGIPDFRSANGLWAHADPSEIATQRSFQRDPHRFYSWFRPLAHTIRRADPNPAHHALVALERLGKLRGVITQNIDGLHQRAGSREVYELHGHLREATCLRCEHRVPSERLMKRIDKGETPRCSCGGVFKPDIVLFDDPLPRTLFWMAQRMLEQADLLIVAGTSLEVFPVNELPLYARRNGAKLLIVNQSATDLDAYADLVIRDDVAAVLPLLVQHLE